MKKLLVFIILTVMLSSCSCSKEKDSLNKHKGTIVATRQESWEHNYFLYLKEKGNAELIPVQVSYGEYDYYKDGDTIQ